MNTETATSIAGLFSATIILAVSLAVSLIVVVEQRDSAKKEIHDFQQQAVKKGFAQWVVKGYNDTEFKWKE